MRIPERWRGQRLVRALTLVTAALALLLLVFFLVLAVTGRTAAPAGPRSGPSPGGPADPSRDGGQRHALGPRPQVPSPPARALAPYPGA